MIEALREEEKKLRLVRFIVDLNQAVLMQQADLTLREAFDILSNTRKAVLNLFPGKEEVLICSVPLHSSPFHPSCRSLRLCVSAVKNLIPITDFQTKSTGFYPVLFRFFNFCYEI